VTRIMFRASFTCVFVALAAGIIATSATAHHSAAMFDNTRDLSIEGTVKEWQWTNPHAWLQLVTADGKGGTVIQGFEFGSPNTLVRNGFKKTSFLPGEKVRMIYHPRRDGTPGGEAGWVKSVHDGWLKWITKAPMPA
jgi:hypothetical protein